MRLVEHPAADLPLLQGLSQGAVAQLLGRDEHDAGVAQAHLVEGVPSFRHGQQAVDGDAGGDAARLQPGYLICHQRHQGRDDHGEGAGLVVAGQGRNLVAQGFAGAGGQDAEDVPAGHDGFDDGLLHGAAVVLGNGPEGGEAEPALQFLAGVVAFAAPGAAGIAAGGVAQALQKAACLGELELDPRRQDRVAAGHGEPSENVGERPVRGGYGGQGFTGVHSARGIGQALVHRGVGLGVGRTASVAEAGEEEVAAGCLVVSGGQPVPSGQEFRVRLRQGSALVVEDLQGEAGVELRIVNLTTLEQAVLVVFDQVVVGVARKGQGAELQGIDRRQLQQAQVRLGGFQVRQVEGNEVVAEQQISAASQPSLVNAAVRVRLPVGKTSRSSVSARTAARAWMRASLLPTSRSRERQAFRERLTTDSSSDPRG